MCVYSWLIYRACKAHAPYYTVNSFLSVVPYFSTLSYKWHDFRKNVVEN